jgi:BirA family biotin operon repressor/biotin-[acetyl-CoA-carboxylase] ligase
MNFAASLVLARTLCGMFNISARVKWPNDILVNGKKLSGMLSEIQAESDRVTFLNIGIGINVNNSPSSQEPQAVSLREILGKKISRKCILAAFLDNFQDFINTHPLHNVISEWKQYAVNLNKHVKIVTTRDTSHGLAIDVDKNGALVLKLENGTIKKIIYGDCFLRQT